MRVGRLAAACALLLLLVCTWQTSGSAEPRINIQRFAIEGPDGAQQAIAVWAGGGAPREPLPLVIAFHGRGESQLGQERGYPAWVDRYGLDKAYAALLDAPLSTTAFGGLVRPGELRAINGELAQRGYRGVMAVGVYTPDLLAHAERSAAIARYATWVARELVPGVQRTFPFVSRESRSVGVDGVSLGGALALEVGLRFPDVFHSVGAMQPAIRGRAAELAALAERARRQHRQAIRLLSSDGDPLLAATRELSRELRRRHIDHRLVVTPGGHDYAFNRGPGAIELLRFHDAALRAAATESEPAK